MVCMRIFGGEEGPTTEAVVGLFHQYWPDAAVLVEEDAERGWLALRVALGDVGAVVLERFTRAHDDIVGELQSWAGWLETKPMSARIEALMLQVMSAQQVFVVHVPEAGDCVDRCRTISAALAKAIAGCYQVDGEGFFMEPAELVARE